jgi:drug/metabolite transporter (DMT)-like permease
VFLVLAPLAVVLSIIPIYRLAKRHQRDPVLAIVICIAVAVMLAGVGFVVWAMTGPSGSAGALAVGSALLSAIAILTVVPLLAWHGRPRRPAHWQPPDRSQRAG